MTVNNNYNNGPFIMITKQVLDPLLLNCEFNPLWINDIFSFVTKSKLCCFFFVFFFLKPSVSIRSPKLKISEPAPNLDD